MTIEDKDFIGREFPQNCGDSLFVDKKVGYRYECHFISHFYKRILNKSQVLSKEVKNPQIEIDIFCSKQYLQNCGDTLKINRVFKNKQNKTIYECEFIKYPYKIFTADKNKVINGGIVNSLIEENEFIGNSFLQNCGDTLIVKKKSLQKCGNISLFEVKFINYPFETLATKRNIQKGEVNNPNIELSEFVGKTFELKTGRFKIDYKTNEKKLKEWLFVGHFINEEGIEPTKIKCTKAQVLLIKDIYNPDLISNNKNFLEKFIIKNYINKGIKPTLKRLHKDTNINLSHIGHRIREFGLEEYIDYCPTSSEPEKELRNYIISLNKDTLQESTWDKLNGQEIDIYIPSLKLGFEFNGNYWHSELFKKSNYHQDKSLLAKSKDILLIHIFEYEWLGKEEIIKSLIKSKLGIFEKKIGASKCKIKELDYRTYADFCNENHLQGEAGARVKLGLFYKDELVQIMSFSKPRFTDDFEYEIIRECSKLGCIVIGGKEKLWSYFVKHFTPKSCISYCDFSKFTGNSYLKLGFKKERLNKPGFVWWDEKSNLVYWRNPYKNQEMKDKGYLKIYDCGQLVFTWFK